MSNTPPTTIEIQHNVNPSTQQQVQPSDTSNLNLFQPGDIVRSTTAPFEDRLLLVLDSTHSTTYLQAISGTRIPDFYKPTQDLRYSSRDRTAAEQLIYSAEIHPSDSSSDSSTSSDHSSHQRRDSITPVNVPHYIRTQQLPPDNLTLDQWKP